MVEPTIAPDLTTGEPWCSDIGGPMMPMDAIAVELLRCSVAWGPEVRLLGNIRACELAALAGYHHRSHTELVQFRARVAEIEGRRCDRCRRRGHHVWPPCPDLSNQMGPGESCSRFEAWETEHA